MDEFEWDPKKSLMNKQKHGIDFFESLQIWQSQHINLPNIANSHDGESRSATIGLINTELYTAIWTERDQRIRIISVRRARQNEKEAFWQKTISNR